MDENSLPFVMKQPGVFAIKGGREFTQWTASQATTLINTVYGAISEIYGDRSRNVIVLAAESNSTIKSRELQFRFPIKSIYHGILNFENAVKMFPGLFEAVFGQQCVEKALKNPRKDFYSATDEWIYILVGYEPRGDNHGRKKMNFGCGGVLLDDIDYQRAAAKAKWNWKWDLKNDTREEPLFNYGVDAEFNFVY